MRKKQIGELPVALIWIAVYVLAMSLCDNFSETVGIEKVFTAPVSVALSAAVWLFIARKDRKKYYGFCPVSAMNWKELWYGIPFLLLSTVNLWNGVSVKNSTVEIMLYVASMICVGFLEEVLFRGFLFRAMLKENAPAVAVVVSSVTFGLGHIVNLLNGAELFPTLMQLAYATAAGFVFTLFVFKTGNIIPCILCHAVLNSLSIVGIEPEGAVQMVRCAVLVVVSMGYAVHLYRIKEAPVWTS